MLLSHPKIYLSLKLLLSFIKQQKLWWKRNSFTIKPKINAGNSKQGRTSRWLCAISKIKEMMWKTLQSSNFSFCHVRDQFQHSCWLKLCHSITSLCMWETKLPLIREFWENFLTFKQKPLIHCSAKSVFHRQEKCGVLKLLAERMQRN